MEKDFTKQYITEAFRLFARLGCPPYERAREIVYQQELNKRSECRPDIAVVQAERAVEKQTPTLLDILAVEETISILEKGEKSNIVSAVKAVYFVNPQQPLRRGDISNRVRRFAITYPADERTVYRWLKEARLLCAAIRGLRISDADERKFRIVL